MNGENQPLVTDEPVAFQNQPVEVSGKLPSFTRNLCNIPQIDEENPQKIINGIGWTLETLGF
jgi:hypothetical protein